jgi:hypothetical protein
MRSQAQTVSFRLAVAAAAAARSAAVDRTSASNRLLSDVGPPTEGRTAPTSHRPINDGWSKPEASHCGRGPNRGRRHCGPPTHVDKPPRLPMLIGQRHDISADSAFHPLSISDPSRSIQLPGESSFICRWFAICGGGPLSSDRQAGI